MATNTTYFKQNYTYTYFANVIDSCIDDWECRIIGWPVHLYINIGARIFAYSMEVLY